MSGADVIIVGGGPSGVSAALELRRRGVQRVVLLERDADLGGATRHCGHSPFGISEFGRLYFGAAYGRRLEREAEKAGVKVRKGYSVVALGNDGAVTTTSASGVETLRPRRLLLATGARETPRSARFVTGDRPVGIVTTGALQAYVAFHGLMPFRRPLIVGSELISFSAALTCLSHGAHPVAMLEPEQHCIARPIFALFPAIARIPFHRGTEIVDIHGRSRVEAATIRRADGTAETISCDGIVFSGRFTPEAALCLTSELGVDRGSHGPAIDQEGRTAYPRVFAAGNLLRAVETGGWAFREGRAVGAALAADLERSDEASNPLPVTFDPPVKLVVPSLLRRGEVRAPAFAQFQLRFSRRAHGRLSLQAGTVEVWAKEGSWLPERRILVPIPASALAGDKVHFRFSESS